MPKGTHIDLFPDLPPNGPTWNGRVKQIPKQTDWDYPQTVNAITNLCREGQVINVYCEGTVLNNLQEDSKQVGATSAVLYHNGWEWKHQEQTFRETVMSNNTTICSILPALSMLTDFLSSQQATTQQNFLILTPYTLIITRALDTSTHCCARLGTAVLYHILVVNSVFFVLGIKSVRSLGCLLYSLYFLREDLVH